MNIHDQQHPARPAAVTHNETITLKAFFAFARHPFPPACAPEPLFRSDSILAALALAKGALASRLHLLITAPAGLGKSSFCRLLLDELNPRDFKAAYLVGRPLRVLALLRSLADAFGFDASSTATKTTAAIADGFEKIAAATHAHPVVIIDEAQQLPVEAIELLRLIAETRNKALLSIVLAATEDFSRRLARPAFAPLAGRFNLHLRLHPLSPEQTADFIEHAFTAVGMQNILAPTSVTSVHAAAAGSPRRIGALIAAAMQRAMLKRSRLLTDEIVQEVIDESAV